MKQPNHFHFYCYNDKQNYGFQDKKCIFSLFYLKNTVYTEGGKTHIIPRFKTPSFYISRIFEKKIYVCVKKSIVITRK